MEAFWKPPTSPRRHHAGGCDDADPRKRREIMIGSSPIMPRRLLTSRRSLVRDRHRPLTNRPQIARFRRGAHRCRSEGGHGSGLFRPSRARRASLAVPRARAGTVGSTRRVGRRLVRAAERGDWTRAGGDVNDSRSRARGDCTDRSSRPILACARNNSVDGGKVRAPRAAKRPARNVIRHLRLTALVQRVGGAHRPASRREQA
jgi:hypothetical protein